MPLEADLKAVEALARSVAHLHRRHAVPAFHAFASRQEWHGTPAWFDAWRRFLATWRAARTQHGQREADRAARNEWRAA
jgi:hypothetical protein